MKCIWFSVSCRISLTVRDLYTYILTNVFPPLQSIFDGSLHHIILLFIFHRSQASLYRDEYSFFNFRWEWYYPWRNMTERINGLSLLYLYNSLRSLRRNQCEKFLVNYLPITVITIFFLLLYYNFLSNVVCTCELARRSEIVFYSSVSLASWSLWSEATWLFTILISNSLESFLSSSCTGRALRKRYLDSDCCFLLHKEKKTVLSGFVP